MLAQQRQSVLQMPSHLCFRQAEARGDLLARQLVLVSERETGAMHRFERGVREEILRGGIRRRRLGRDHRLSDLSDELTLQLLAPPVVDGAIAHDGNQPAGQPFLVDPIELAMELEKGVCGDFFRDVAPADGSRRGSEHGRQMSTVDVVERHGPEAGGRQVYATALRCLDRLHTPVTDIRRPRHNNPGARIAPPPPAGAS